MSASNRHGSILRSFRFDAGVGGLSWAGGLKPIVVGHHEGKKDYLTSAGWRVSMGPAVKVEMDRMRCEQAHADRDLMH